MVPHGGQNPLEPVRMGSFILHGPYIQNFKEIYAMLSKLNVSSEINNIVDIKRNVFKKIKYKQPQSILKKLNFIGNSILKKNLDEIKKYI